MAKLTWITQRLALAALWVASIGALSAQPLDLVQEANTWVKRSPLTATPVSPRLGYEGACAWDNVHLRLIRYGGHNQGGGGEQHAEVWAFDPLTAKWELKEPNASPPGVCCAQQNVFDAIRGRYLRFPAFSGSHGWQWWREIYLNDSSVWSYDLGENKWRNLRPLPAPSPRPLRCASWDSDNQVVVLFGGEGSSEGTWVYDPYTNTWTGLNPSPQPAFRSGGNMAYDSTHKLHLLFGSQFTDDPHTWAYDLPKNQWRDLKPPAMPPTDKNDAVLTYDPIRKVILAVVKITQGEDEQATHRLETWTYDTGANRWTKMNPQPEPDPTSNRARVLMFAPELNVAILENRTHGKVSNEQQIWTYRTTPRGPEPSLLPPTNLRVKADPNGATLTWQASPSAMASRYEILFSETDAPWRAQYQRLSLVDSKESSWRGSGVRRGLPTFYAIRSVAANGRLSAFSLSVRTQPGVPKDPVVSVLSANKVELIWKASDDAAGYHVERAPVEVLTEDQLPRLKKQTPPPAEPSVGVIRRVGSFVRLTQTPVKETRFVDMSIELSKPAAFAGDALYERKFSAEQLNETGRAYRFAVYAYRVRAVNALDVESGASAFCLTIPSTPQWLFAKEEGTACQLKWAANPEQGIKGYRVYRMNGRYDKDPIPRLTTEPISSLTYTDPEAGKTSRRYYVVAVDALGQEGFPSSPVWFEREWRRFYVPFIGEWHQ
jgi:hypothetical protein